VVNAQLAAAKPTLYRNPVAAPPPKKLSLTPDQLPKLTQIWDSIQARRTVKYGLGVGKGFNVVVERSPCGIGTKLGTMIEWVRSRSIEPNSNRVGPYC
jgi:hypothetical protein